MENIKDDGKMLDSKLVSSSLQGEKQRKRLSKPVILGLGLIYLVAFVVLLGSFYHAGYRHGFIQTAMGAAGLYEEPCNAAKGIFFNETCFIGSGNYSYQMLPHVVLSVNELEWNANIDVWLLSGLWIERYYGSLPSKIDENFINVSDIEPQYFQQMRNMCQMGCVYSFDNIVHYESNVIGIAGFNRSQCFSFCDVIGR